MPILRHNYVVSQMNSFKIKMTEMIAVTMKEDDIALVIRVQYNI